MNPNKVTSYREVGLAFELRKFVRPVHFAEGEGLPWGFGTAIIVQYKSDFFIVTARHVLENQQAKVEDFRVRLDGVNIAIPVCSFSKVKVSDGSSLSSPEDLDVIIFEVDQRLYKSISLQPLISYCTEESVCSSYFIPDGAELLVAGYPEIENRYDYESEKINDPLAFKVGTKSVLGMGDPMYMFSGEPFNKTYNGMSGAPVFWIENGVLKVTGMVLMGTASSGILHYVDFRVIFSAVAKVWLKLQACN